MPGYFGFDIHFQSPNRSAVCLPEAAEVRVNRSQLARLLPGGDRPLRVVTKGQGGLLHLSHSRSTIPFRLWRIGHAPRPRQEFVQHSFRSHSFAKDNNIGGYRSGWRRRASSTGLQTTAAFPALARQLLQILGEQGGLPLHVQSTSTVERAHAYACRRMAPHHVAGDPA